MLKQEVLNKPIHQVAWLKVRKLAAYVKPYQPVLLLADVGREERVGRVVQLWQRQPVRVQPLLLQGQTPNNVYKEAPALHFSDVPCLRERTVVQRLFERYVLQQEVVLLKT